MSILESESPAHAMTESGGHVLGRGNPKNSGWTWDSTSVGTTNPGDTIYQGWPYGTEYLSFNDYHATSIFDFTQGVGYFDGTWAMLWFPIAPVKQPGGGNIWVMNNADIGAPAGYQSKLKWEFGDAWSTITPAEFNTPGPITRGKGPDFGIWFVAKLGTPGGPDPKNNYTITWLTAVKSGRYFLSNSARMIASTLLLRNNDDGTQDFQSGLLLTGAQIQPAQPRLLLISADGTQTADVTNTTNPAGVNNISDLILFGRRTDFFPQIVFPSRNVALVPPPYSIGGDASGVITAYPDYTKMNTVFQGVPN